MSGATTSGGLWWARVGDGASGREQLFGFDTGIHPSHTVLDCREAPDEAACVVVDTEDGLVRRITVAPALVPAAPPLWYAALPELDADPAAMVLVAVPTDHRPAGSVVARPELAELGVRSSEQAAALRWWYGSGLVHQIYVAPVMRRRGIAFMLLLAASGLRAAHGWPALHGDGRRTELGESFVNALPLVRRNAAARTQILPPMTPQA